MAYWLLACLCASVQASQWAVLVAGSSGYWNYRHQADLCHAYQLLVGQGFPQEHIIVLSSNDVVESNINPLPGHLFNAPGLDPPDVYPGCRVDYNGTNCNSTNFLAVLTGNSTWLSNIGTGRVLESGPEDTVFLYYVDHGVPGLVAFPTDLLYADTFQAALQEMHTKKMYSQMVIFMEACYSGSMFDGLLPDNIGIYAVTAANDTEASFATYCPPDADVNDVEMYTCLGDLFSVSWMSVAASSNLTSVTVHDLYTATAALTNESHVMEFGDMSVAALPAANFLGFLKNPNVNYWVEPNPAELSWTAFDSKYQFFAYLYLVEPTPENAELLLAEIHARVNVTTIFTELMNIITPQAPERLLEESLPVFDFECLRTNVGAFEELCQPMQEFALRYAVVLKNACEEGIDPAQVRAALESICQGPKEVAS